MDNVSASNGKAWIPDKNSDLDKRLYAQMVSDCRLMVRLLSSMFHVI